MKCPVCNIHINPLDEHCNNCMSTWKLGQKDCPAVVRDAERQIIARCPLPFSHKDRKHKVMGFRFYPEGPELTFLWWYPETTTHKYRADEFFEIHGGK